MVAFVDLIEDMLLHIFAFLDPADLYTLYLLNETSLTSAVNLTLNRQIGKSMLLTGRDCVPSLPPLEDNEDRLRIHSNWTKGQFQESVLFENENLQHIGGMRMDSGHFYVANKGELRMYARRSEDGLAEDTFESFGDIEVDPIISTLHLQGHHLFTGTYYGTCSYIRNGQKLIDNLRIHDSYKDILAMDYHEERRVLASCNFREIKLFGVNDREMRPLVETADYRGRCLKLNQTGANQLVVGNIVTDFHTSEGFIVKLTPLSLYDTATMERRNLRCESSGVVDILWHSSPSVILTSHWTGDVRVFDLRSDSDEMIFKKPGVEDVNVSLQYDGQHGVVCGFRRTNEVSLYDLRQSKGPIKSFGQFKNTEGSTQLSGILVDPRHLFVLNSYEVKVCDFTR